MVSRRNMMTNLKMPKKLKRKSKTSENKLSRNYKKGLRLFRANTKKQVKSKSKSLDKTKRTFLLIQTKA